MMDSARSSKANRPFVSHAVVHILRIDRSRRHERENRGHTSIIARAFKQKFQFKIQARHVRTEVMRSVSAIWFLRNFLSKCAASRSSRADRVSRECTASKTSSVTARRASRFHVRRSFGIRLRNVWRNVSNGNDESVRPSREYRVGVLRMYVSKKT